MRDERPADGAGHLLMARVSAPDLKLDSGACVAPIPSDPCSIVILGATGDLTSRKLMPALFSLYRNGGLPKPFLIVGCGRTQWTDAEFRGRMAEAIRAGGGDDSRWRQFSDSIHYRAVDYLDARSVADLAHSLRDL